MATAMARRTRIVLWSTLGMVGALALMSVLVVFAFGADRLKGFLESRIDRATGRTVTIDGDIAIDWGWVPQVMLTGLSLTNAEWSETPTMTTIEQLTFTIDPWELLRGRVVLPEVALKRPDLLLERSAEGEANWTFDLTGTAEAATPDSRAKLPIIGRLVIDDGRVVYRDAVRNVDIQSRISTVIGEGGGGEGRVRLTGTGTVVGEPFDLQVEAGALTDLRDPDEPYPMKGTMRVGDTEAAVDGTLLRPASFGGMDFSLAINGSNVGDLFPIIGLPAPTTPPYDVTGRLTREGDVWRFEGFKGKVGDSDLAGTLVFDTGGERLRITGDLTSNRLDFDDLGGLVGAPPDLNADRAPTPAADAGSGELLPTTPIDFARVRTVDAQVRFQGRDVIAPNLPLEDVDVDIALNDGILRLDPLDVGIAGGHILSAIQIDAREDTVVADMDIHLDGFRLEQIADGSVGRGEIFGRAQIRTWGNSVNAAFGTADGDFALMMTEGAFSALLVELIGLDAAEALDIVLDDETDAEVALRCAVLDFAVESGRLKSRALMIDTTDTQIVGEGVIDLEDEAYEIRMLAHPKDPSPFSARAPVMIAADSFTDFGFSVDAAALGIRAGVALALGALLTPLASALAFIEPGLGPDSPCGALTEQAQRNTAKPPGR